LPPDEIIVRCKYFLAVIGKIKITFWGLFHVDYIELKVPASDNEIWDYALAKSVNHSNQ